MSLKNTLMLGAAGAAAIYIARQSPFANEFDKHAPWNNKTVPGIAADSFMPRNDWSFAFVAIPAIGAWYLSR